MSLVNTEKKFYIRLGDNNDNVYPISEIITRISELIKTTLECDNDIGTPQNPLDLLYNQIVNNTTIDFIQKYCCIMSSFDIKEGETLAPEKPLKSKKLKDIFHNDDERNLFNSLILEDAKSNMDQYMHIISYMYCANYFGMNILTEKLGALAAICLKQHSINGTREDLKKLHVQCGANIDDSDSKHS